MGFDREYLYIYHKTTRKKNLWFWTKCGFEIDKEIKGNKAEKWWGLIQSFDLAYIHDQTKKEENSWILDKVWI